MNILVNALALDFRRSRGIENYAIGIARGLAQHIDHVYFYVHTSGAEHLSREFSTFDNVHLLAVPDVAPKSWLTRTGASWAFRLLRRARIELTRAYQKRLLRQFSRRVHIDGVFNPFHLVPFKPLLNVPALSAVHRVLDDYTAEEIDVSKSHLIGADVVACCWPIPYQELTELMPAHAAKVVQIPYLSDHLLVTPDLSVRQTHGLSQDFFFYPAVVVPRKNHINLIKAYGLLKEQGVDMPDLVCSGGFVEESFMAEIEDLLASHGLQEQVRFIGHVSSEEMAGLYSLCTAAVSSSFNEAGMAVIQEAGYLGRPVICSNTPEAKAQAAQYDWDLPMFDPAQPADIAKVLQRFLDEEPDHTETAQTASRAIRHYTPEHIGGCYAELFAWICHTSERPDWYPFG